MVSRASVATKGGTLNLVMVQPLNTPSSVPVSRPATTAAQQRKADEQVCDRHSESRT